MTRSTAATDADPTADPTLASLVPRSSPGRNLVVVAAALLALVAVWLSPQVLRPVAVSQDSGGSWEPLPTHRQVLATTQLELNGWPYAIVESVDDVPGADVAGAWILTDAAASDGARADPAAFATGLDYLRAAFPRDAFGEASRLPHRLDQGESMRLLILWDITDCSQLVVAQRAEIRVSSALATTSTQELPEWSAPGFDVPLLRETGSCPAP